MVWLVILAVRSNRKPIHIYWFPMFTFDYGRLKTHIAKKANDHPAYVVGMTLPGFITIKPAVGWGAHEVRQQEHFCKVFNGYIARRWALTQTTCLAQRQTKSLIGTIASVSMVKTAMASLDLTSEFPTSKALIGFHTMEQSITNAINKPDVMVDEVLKNFETAITTMRQGMAAYNMIASKAYADKKCPPLQIASAVQDYLEDVSGKYQQYLTTQRFGGELGAKRKAKLQALIARINKEKDNNERIMAAILEQDTGQPASEHEQQPVQPAGYAAALRGTTQEVHAPGNMPKPKPPASAGTFVPMVKKTMGATAQVPWPALDMWEDTDSEDDRDDTATGGLISLTALTIDPEKIHRHQQGTDLRKQIAKHLSDKDQVLLDDHDGMINLLVSLASMGCRATPDLPAQIHAAAIYMGACSQQDFPLITPEDMASLIMSGRFRGTAVTAVAGDIQQVNAPQLMAYLDQLNQPQVHQQGQEHQRRRRKKKSRSHQ